MAQVPPVRQVRSPSAADIKHPRTAGKGQVQFEAGVRGQKGAEA